MRKFGGLAVAVALSLASGGCSLLFVHGPPPGHASMNAFDCTSSALAPGIDLLWAAGWLGDAYAGAQLPASDSNRQVLLGLGIGGAVVGLLSAVYGFGTTGDCSHAQAELFARLNAPGAPQQFVRAPDRPGAFYVPSPPRPSASIQLVDERGLIMQPSQRWAPFGFAQLRWGMGPSDVDAALGSAPADGLRVVSRVELLFGGTLSEYGVTPSPAFTAAGYHLRDVRLLFVRDRLYSVRLVPSVPLSRWSDWADEVIPAMTTTYGQPEQSVTRGNERMAGWRYGVGNIAVALARPDGITIEHTSVDLLPEAQQAEAAIRSQSPSR